MHLFFPSETHGIHISFQGVAWRHGIASTCSPSPVNSGLRSMYYQVRPVKAFLTHLDGSARKLRSSHNFSKDLKPFQSNQRSSMRIQNVHNMPPRVQRKRDAKSWQTASKARAAAVDVTCPDESAAKKFRQLSISADQISNTADACKQDEQQEAVSLS